MKLDEDSKTRKLLMLRSLFSLLIFHSILNFSILFILLLNPGLCA